MTPSEKLSPTVGEGVQTITVEAPRKLRRPPALTIPPRPPRDNHFAEPRGYTFVTEPQ